MLEVTVITSLEYAKRFTLHVDGGLAFSQPQGTHDDVFWATALAVYGPCEMSPEPYLAVVPR
jgi:hypothetical protein